MADNQAPVGGQQGRFPSPFRAELPEGAEKRVSEQAFPVVVKKGRISYRKRGMKDIDVNNGNAGG